VISANDEIDRARRYHDRTAHSPESVRRDRHRLDWANLPAPFKLYPDLPVVALPRAIVPPAMDTFAALSAPGGDAAPLDVERLGAILFHAAGVTRTRSYPGGETMYYRAAPSTGALYQTEAYVVAGTVAGLDPGVYHFSPGDFALRRLRAGDFRGALAEAAADDDIAARPCAVVLTAIYWRNTWKYQARGYRHLFWDSGTLLAQLLAAARALQTPARIVTGFVDGLVNALLGVDPGREGALEIVPLGGPGPVASPSPAVVPVAPTVVPLSSREVDYPLLAEAYADSSLLSEAEVLDWRERGAGLVAPATAGGHERGGSGATRAAGQPGPPAPAPLASPPPELTPLPAPRPGAGRSLGETIERRGSTREFSGEGIGADELSTALFHATRGIAADVPPKLVDLYLTVHAVDGVPPGAYAYHPDTHALEALKTGDMGDMRRDAAFLCLEQPLGGASSATVFFLADLGRVLGALGNRGYRVANLLAGVIGGRLYLGAYAQRFGATGLTFYDHPVVAFFSPHARGKDALFVTALGRSVGRARRGA
jgi:SagB-type dehydrogenase family enzyme